MKNFFQSFNILNQEELNYIESKITVKKLEKGEFLIKEGEIIENVAFIKKGILRSFYNTEQGDEITYCITFENVLMTALTSYISGNPTLENIQAIVETELEVIPKSELKKLSEISANYIKLEKILIEQQYIQLENRIFSFQKEKAKERYLELLKNQPYYIQQIPLQYIASYLGISLRHLTRIRKTTL